MSQILIPGGESQEEGEPLKFQSSERDEEIFFLMYHMNLQPSEAQALDDDYRKWLIARFVTQKKLEQEMMERHRLMSALGPNLAVPNA